MLKTTNYSIIPATDGAGALSLSLWSLKLVIMSVAVSFELILQIIMVTDVSLLPSSGSILQLQYTS